MSSTWYSVANCSIKVLNKDPQHLKHVTTFVHSLTGKGPAYSGPLH